MIVVVCCCCYCSCVCDLMGQTARLCDGCNTNNLSLVGMGCFRVTRALPWMSMTLLLTPSFWCSTWIQEAWWLSSMLVRQIGGATRHHIPTCACRRLLIGSIVTTLRILFYTERRYTLHSNVDPFDDIRSARPSEPSTTEM